MNVIDVCDLRKTYCGGSWRRKSDFIALSGVSIGVRRGEVFGLLGPNGAGKTTLIKILLGVIGASGGRASLLDQPAGSAAARSRVGYLPESLRVDRHHTARSAISFYGRLSGLDAATIRSRRDELLSLVGLTGRDRESVRRFSKGMLQRLGLAQALLHDPDLLILDEPTDGLDPVGRAEVRRVIERLRDAGKTIFLNSHILHEVEMVCSHLAIMNKGEVLASGPLEAMRNHDFGDSKTSRTTFEIHADADDESLRQIADGIGAPMERTTRFADATIRFELVDADQPTLDRTVDEVRRRGWSLLKMEPQRQTLEETFMRLVGND